MGSNPYWGAKVALKRSLSVFKIDGIVGSRASIH